MDRLTDYSGITVLELTMVTNYTKNEKLSISDSSLPKNEVIQLTMLPWAWLLTLSGVGWSHTGMRIKPWIHMT